MHLEKRQIEIKSGRLSLNPSKNYLFTLLADDIARLGQRTALDAGCGTLRHYWMFQSRYVGIGHDVQTVRDGRRYGDNQKLIAARGMPELYVMRLESDFSFLGSFDLCVCTETIFYTEDPLDVAIRLANCVAQNGALILTDHGMERLPGYLEILRNRFTTVDVVYWGHVSCNFYNDAWTKADIHKLTAAEMAKPNQPEGHDAFYIVATGKKLAPRLIGVRPEMIDFDGMYICKKDLPRLLNTHLIDGLPPLPQTAP